MTHLRVAVEALGNAYLSHKDALLDAGEFLPRTRQNYQETADLLI